MKKVSEVLQLAVNDPRYLTEKMWLCSLIYELHIEGVLTQKEMRAATEHIIEAIGGMTFLRSYLYYHKLVKSPAPYTSPEYYKAAMKFWNRAIAALKKQNL